MGMTGAYERNLDAKGRLSLPAPLREELGEHVRVFKALDVDALYVFSAEASISGSKDSSRVVRATRVLTRVTSTTRSS